MTGYLSTERRNYGQTRYSFYSQDGIPGQVFGLGNHRALPYLNRAGHVAQVQTLTPPADIDISEGDIFYLNFDGYVISHTVPTGEDTALAVGLAFYGLIRTTGTVYKAFSAVTINNTTGVITVTSARANISYPIAEVDISGVPLGTPNFTITQTVAPGTDQEIGFGLFVGLPTADLAMNAPSSIHEIDPVQSATLMGATLPGDFTMFGITMNPSTQESPRLFDDAADVFKSGKPMPVLLDTVDRQGIWVQSTTAFNQGAAALYVDPTGRLTDVATDNFDISSRVEVVKRSSVHNPNIGDSQIITPVRFWP